MFKGLIKDPDGSKTLMLGFSHKNLELLKDNQPILFNASDLELPPIDVLITHQHDDGRWSHPTAADPANTFCIALTDRSAEQLRAGGTHSTYNDELGATVVLFAAETEQAIEEMVRPGIKPSTKFRRVGFAPSDIPPSPN